MHVSYEKQSLGRVLSETEERLAIALERIFAGGQHQFDEVSAALQRLNVPRPSGAAGAWSASVLEDELRLINASLDDAYARNPPFTGDAQS